MSGEKSTQQNESQSTQRNLAPNCSCNFALPQACVACDLQQNSVNTEAEFVFGNTARSLMQRTQRRGNDTDSLPDLEIAVKPTTYNNVPIRSKDDISAMMMMEKQYLADKRRSSADEQLRKSNSSEMKPNTATIHLKNPGTEFNTNFLGIFINFTQIKAQVYFNFTSNLGNSLNIL
jgi:hypothetical protein